MARTAATVAIEQTPADHMASALNFSKITADQTRRNLIGKMRDLRHTLDGAIANLEWERAPNSLGEIQSQAAIIDALCGGLAAKTEAYEALACLAAKLDLLP